MTPEEIKILASNLRFQKRYTVGQVPVTMDAAADALDTLLDRLEKAEKDAARLDWIDSQGYGYGFQDMHEGNRWTIDGPFANVRIAIDYAMEASK